MLAFLLFLLSLNGLLLEIVYEILLEIGNLIEYFLPKVVCALLKLLDSVFWKSIINTRLLLISDAYFEVILKVLIPRPHFF